MTRRTIEIAAFAAALLLAALAFHAWLAAHDEQLRLQSTLAVQKQLIDAASASERAREATLNGALAQIDKLKRATQTPGQIIASLQKYLALPEPIALANTTPPSTTPNLPAMPPDGPPDERKNQQGSHPAETPRDSLSSAPNSLPTPLSPPGVPSAGQAVSGRPAAFPANLLPNSPAAPSGERPSPNPIPSGPSSTTPSQQLSPPDSSCVVSAQCAAEIPSADLKPLYDYIQDCRACDAQLAVAKQNASDDASKIAALTRERNAALTAEKGGSFWRRLRRNVLWLSVGAALGVAASAAR